VDSVSTNGKVDAQWQASWQRKKAEELEQIIVEENLNAEGAKSFVDNAFRDGSHPDHRHRDHEILPPVSGSPRQRPCGQEADGAGQAGRILRAVFRLSGIECPMKPRTHLKE
jgi:hypothetical protein